ncbi:MAG: cobalt ECF transporter T component CbiQ [Anaerolineales bacterium]
MHFDAFDRYHEHESFIHRLDPRVKAATTVLFIVSNALLPDGAWNAFFAAWMFLLAANFLSNLGTLYTFKRSLIALPFALIALTALFSTPGKALLQLTLFSLNFSITDAGVLRFFGVVIRSWLSVQMAILLVSTTRFPDLIHALEHLRVPATLTTIIAFLYRYLFVLVDEVYRLLRAREARSAALNGRKPGGSLLWRARAAGNMAGQLFLRSYERSDRIYNAMISRGYAGQLYTLNPHEMKARDYFTLAATAALLFLFQWIGRL